MGSRELKILHFPCQQADEHSSAWDHAADYFCWVPAGSTDEACPTTGSSKSQS